MEWLSFVLFAVVVLALLADYPVAFTLAGVSLIFASLGAVLGIFDMAYLEALPSRVFGVMRASSSAGSNAKWRASLRWRGTGAAPQARICDS